MYRSAAALVVLLLIVVVVVHSESFPEEEYGYIQQSTQFQSAFFYAIRGNPNATFRQSAPLVLFLQGGPGATSLFSCFLETGPLKLQIANNTQGYDLVARHHTWTNHVTMLYVDNPIGTGFSYTTDPQGFSTTDEDIANKLVDFLGKFLAKHSEYVTTPFWVFCESYGGKMTAYLGAALAKAIATKSITINFKGVALGDGWVDPVQCMKSYGPYLKTFSQVNEHQQKEIDQCALYAETALEENNGTLATHWWGVQQDFIGAATPINFYNALYYYDYTADNQLDVFLATNFTTMLGPIVPPGVSYGSQGDQVFNRLRGTFMHDGVPQVDAILSAGYEVHVYNGQLDLIVDFLCTEGWMNKLQWPYMKDFKTSLRLPVYAVKDSLNVDAFVQGYKNLVLWQIMRAGHMVPLDNPPAAEYMLKTIVAGSSVRNRIENPEPVEIGKLHKRSRHLPS